MRIILALAASIAATTSSLAGATGLIIHDLSGWDYFYVGPIFKYEPSPLEGYAEIGVRLAMLAPKPVRSDIVFASDFEPMRKWRWVVALDRGVPGSWVSGQGYCSSSYDGVTLVLTCINASSDSFDPTPEDWAYVFGDDGGG